MSRTRVGMAKVLKDGSVGSRPAGGGLVASLLSRAGEQAGFGLRVLLATLALLLVASAPGLPCTKSGSRYLCSDSGDPVTNGQNLQAAIHAADCGETIVLPAGVNFDTTIAFHSGTTIIGYPITLPYKGTAACSAANPEFITITSSRAEELPPGVRVTPADAEKMPRIRSTSSYPALRLTDRAHHWKLVGLLLSSAPNVDAGCTAIPTVTCTASGYLLAPPENISGAAMLPHDVVVERSIFQPHNPDALFASATGGIQWEGRNLTVRDSYIYGFTGWQVNVAGVTQAYHVATNLTAAANPTVTLSPGTGALPGRYEYEFGGFTGDYARLNGYKACDPAGTTNTCTGIQEPVNTIIVEPGSDPKTIQVITKAAHNLNTGYSVTVYTTWPGLSCINNQTFAVTRVNEYRVWFRASGCTEGTYDGTQGYNSGLVIDTRGLTGGLGWVRLVERGNLYGFLSVGGPGPITVENTYVSAQFVTMFFGGIAGYSRPERTAKVLSVESSTQVMLEHTNELSVNDVFAVIDTEGNWRQGKVTAIHGNRVTFAGVGGRPATAVAPRTGSGSSMTWRGYNVSGVTLRRNTFELLWQRNHMGRKGYIEVKSLTDAVIEGNQFVGEEDSQHMFFTARGDWHAPWPTVERVTLRNNVFHSGGTTWNLWDGLNGVATQWDVGDRPPQNRFENNLHVGAILPPINETNRGSLYYRHNTWIQPARQKRGDYPTIGARRIAMNQDCGAYPKGVRPFVFRDNIVNYGQDGFLALGGPQASCWELTKLGNVFVNNRSISISEPGNLVAASVAALQLAGPCDGAGENWRNCKLAAGSPFRGTGSDGRDPGVDMEELEQQVLGWFDSAQVRMTPGSEHAKIEVRLNESKPGAGCKVELFTNAARTVLHADTDTGEEQSCGRAAYVAEEQQLQVVFGTSAALTPGATYWWRITDGTRTLVGSFTTAAPAAGERQIVAQVRDEAADNLVVEYANNAAFAGALSTAPVAFQAGRAETRFPAAARSVVYWRWKKRDGANAVLATGPVRVEVLR